MELCSKTTRLRPMLVLALIITLLGSSQKTAAQDERGLLKMAIFLRHHSFLMRAYQSAKNGQINAEMAQRYRLYDDYKLDRFLSAQLIGLRVYSPEEILGKIELLVKGRMNAVVYISDGTYGAVRASAGQYLLQMAQQMGLPTIAWIGDNSGIVQPSAQDTIIQLTPSISHQCRAMLSVLQRYNWHAFSILTGTLAGQDHFINVLRELTEQMDQSYDFEILSVVNILSDSETAISQQLMQLKESDTRVILMCASRTESEKFFKMAATLGLTSSEYMWIGCKAVMGDTTERRQPSLSHPLGMIGIDFRTDTDHRKEAIQLATKTWVQGLDVAYSRIANSTTVPVNSSLVPAAGDAFAAQYTKWPMGELITNAMKTVTDDDGNRLFNEDGTRTSIKLVITNHNKDHDWDEIGEWTTEGGLDINDITWPGLQPVPPKGVPSKHHLRVVTLEEPPYVYYSDVDPGSGICPSTAMSCRTMTQNTSNSDGNSSISSSTLSRCCSGLCIDILKMLSDKMHVDVELFEVEDRKWGAFSEDTGEWNGLVRSVMDGEADMIVTSLKITQERSEMIDFSVPFLETGITVLVAVRDGVISPTAFLEPYDLRSWCLILLFSVHATGAAILIFEWLSPRGLDRGHQPIKEHQFSLFRSFWLIWAMLFGAAVNVDNPRGVTSRFVANVWALFAVVFMASYTANLAAFMITKEDFDKITGIEDHRLLHPHDHSPPFKFATVPHGSTETTLKKNYLQMHYYMKNFSRTTVKEGVIAVKESEINAFIYDATVLEYLASHDDDCKLRTVGKWYAMTGYGIAFPKSSKWLPEVNKHMIEFIHNGDMERLQKFWLAGACKKSKTKGEKSKPLGILNFTSAFILLAGGTLLGGFLLLLEHIYYKFFRTRLRKMDKIGCCGLVSLSVGKSLTMEQTIHETLEMQKKFRCKDPVCETEMWRLRHELDLAQLKLERPQNSL